MLVAFGTGTCLVLHGYVYMFFTCVILSLRLVGRAAFTGSHQWILSENYRRDAHPPEVYHNASLVSTVQVAFK